MARRGDPPGSHKILHVNKEYSINQSEGDSAAWLSDKPPPELPEEGGVDLPRVPFLQAPDAGEDSG